jgi:nitrogen PTS system EIIA component
VKLTVSDAAAFLGTDEKTVYRWIEDRRLPAERLAGHYRVNRTSLLEWATANGIALSPRVFQDVAGDDEPLPSISAALARGGVHHAVPGGSREDVIREIVGRLPLAEPIDAEDLLAFLLAREAHGSSAIGDGIAIPHVRTPIVLDVDEAIVSACFLSSPVDFGAPDGRPVTTVFTLVTPTVRAHLHLLSALAFLLRDGPFRDAVRARADAATLLAHAAEAEKVAAARREGTGEA